MIFSANSTDDEFVCHVSVPKVSCVMPSANRTCADSCACQEVVAAKGLKASEWVESIKGSFPSAKGGGKDDTAALSGKGAANVRSLP